MGITGYIPSINDTAPFESQRALPFAAIDAGNYSDIPNLFLNKNQGCVYETSYGGFIYYLVAIER